jgi:hypothetical protein
VFLEVVPSLGFAPRKSHAESVYTYCLFVNKVVGGGLTPAPQPPPPRRDFSGSFQTASGRRSACRRELGSSSSRDSPAFLTPFRFASCASACPPSPSLPLAGGGLRGGCGGWCEAEG